MLYHQNDVSAIPNSSLKKTRMGPLSADDATQSYVLYKVSLGKREHA